MRKPMRLRPGGTIAVVAPAGAVDATAMEAGIGRLERAGYRVRVGEAARERQRYLAGSDSARLADLRAALSEPGIDAVLCARGGYGSGRLLPDLRGSAVRPRPIPFVGHSDLTFLLSHLVQRHRLMAFHGPMVTQLALNPEGSTQLLSLLQGERPGDVIAPHVLAEGEGEGVLVGGCLSIVAAMCGTPWSLRTRGCVLFLEDVNEPAYRIDRLLTQLAQAGLLDGIRGLLFGEMPGCFDAGDVRLEDIVREVCPRSSFPILAGVASGHGSGTVTLTLGARVRVAGDRLRFLEAVVR